VEKDKVQWRSLEAARIAIRIVRAEFLAMNASVETNALSP